MQYQREILDALRRIHRALRNSSNVIEENFGISGAQLLILRTLHNEDNISINGLAKRTQTHQSTVSEIVTKLLKAKLVKRNHSSNDKRRVEISLTSKSLKILSQNPPQLAQDRLFYAISNLTFKDQKKLSQLLSKVVTTSGFDTHQASLFFEDDQ